MSGGQEKDLEYGADFGYSRPEAVRITDSVAIGGRRPLCMIAGPCVIESAEQLDACAAAVKQAAKKAALPVVFKASFDKANRSSVKSYRGPGMERGLEMLAEIKERYEIPVTTDIHLPGQAAPVAEVADILQIPAFLCRQTDLLLAAGETGRPVNVKKGQFMSPMDVSNIVDKLRSTGNDKVIITERGTSFGYRTLVTDMRGLAKMRRLGVPVVFDATHSVQTPGGLGTASGGDRNSVILLARSAVAAGVDAVFLETHPDPASARSDGPNMLPTVTLERLFSELAELDALVERFAAEHLS